MLKFLNFVSVIWILLLSSCTSMAVTKRGHIQICGPMLAQTLSLICKGQYYDPGEEENDVRRNIQPELGADFYPDWYFGFSPRRMFDMSRRHPLVPSIRQQRGVVDECCRQPCSPSVLLSYCRTEN